MLKPVKVGINCTAGVHGRKLTPFAAFVLKFIFVSGSSTASKELRVFEPDSGESIS